LTNDLEADLKIRKLGGNWADESITANVGTILEFKINVKTNRDYLTVGILVKLPLIDNTPMFNYVEGSSWPKPIFPIGEWAANDTDVNWAWFMVDSSWSKEMTFKAKIKKSGSRFVDLTVIAVKDMNGNYDEVYDSVSVTAEKFRSVRIPHLLYQKIWKTFQTITSYLRIV